MQLGSSQAGDPLPGQLFEIPKIAVSEILWGLSVNDSASLGTSPMMSLCQLYLPDTNRCGLSWKEGKLSFTFGYKWAS